MHTCIFIYLEDIHIYQNTNNNFDEKDEKISSENIISLTANGFKFKDSKDLYLKNDSEKDYIDKFNEYEVLVIDDLGSTRMSEWETGILDTIIATRYNANLHTIFSSNLSYIGSKIHKQTKEDKILDYKIGERNVSRLFEMCKIIELRGDDYRKRTY